MIRPATCIAMLIAGGSGLYLYQVKHQGYVLDRQIAQVQSETGKLREHTAVLRAEYALLNDPSRLQELASAHLPNLIPLAPGQFTTLAHLDQRLPAAGGPARATPEAPGLPGVRVGHEPYDYPPAPVAVADASHVPATPSVIAMRALLASTAEAAIPAASLVTPSVPRRAATPVAVTQRKPRAFAAAHIAPRRAVSVASALRADPLSIPAAAPAQVSSPARYGSALGMARSTMPPSQVTYTFQRYNPGAAETMGQ